MEPTTTSVFWDGNDLSGVAGANLYNHDFNALPNREIKINKLAREDKSVITTAEYSSKEVTVFLHLFGCERADAELVLRNLKALLQQINKELIVNQAGEETKYIATLNQVSHEWFGGKLKVTLVFVCSDPIGQATTATTGIATTNITTQTINIALDIEGSFIAEPVITLTMTDITDGTDVTVTVKNNIIGQGISLTRDWADGDIVTIDSAEKTVTINGGDSDFSGIFPFFYPGDQVLGYIDGFSARDVDLTLTYVKRSV